MRMEKLISIISYWIKNNQITIYVSLIFVYCLLIGLQGFDMCDEGWEMTACQQIFNEPSTIVYQFLYYNTLLIGGLWNSIWGGLVSYYGFRILASLFISGTALMIFLTLRRYVGKFIIFIGLCLCLSCWNFGIFVFHHNYLTMFMVSLSCFLIQKSLDNRSLTLLFFSAFIIGINIFSRLPNITMCALFLGILPFYIKQRNIMLKSIFSIIFGLIMGIMVIFALMFALGHLDYFWEAMNMMKIASSDTQSTHGIGEMLNRYCHNYVIIIIHTIIVLLPMVLIVFIKKISKYVLLSCIVIYEVLILKKIDVLFVLYGISSLALIFGYIKSSVIETKVLCILAFVWLHFLPFGSDLGIMNMGTSCIWLAIPLAISIIKDNLYLLKNTETHFIIKISLIFVLILLYSVNCKSINSQCYFDKGNRLYKTYKMEHPLINVFITKEKKIELETLYTELTKYVKPNDYLLQYLKCPTIHYMTQTRPFLGNSWVWSYPPSLIKYKLDNAIKETGVLPVIVRDKSMIGHWDEYSKTWNNDKAKDTFEHKNQKVTLINNFISNYDYHVVWENHLFQILTTNKKTACK